MGRERCDAAEVAARQTVRVAGAVRAARGMGERWLRGVDERWLTVWSAGAVWG